MDAVLAAIISAVVSVAVTLWLRRSERPKPDWIFASFRVPITASLAEYLRTERAGKDPNFMVMATNAGDGTAYQLEVEGIDADVTLFIKDNEDQRKFRVPAKLARVEPGEELGVLIWFHPSFDHSKVGFRLRWIQEPVRQMRYDEREVSLASPEAQPRRGLQVMVWLRRLRAVPNELLARLAHRPAKPE